MKPEVFTEWDTREKIILDFMRDRVTESQARELLKAIDQGADMRGIATRLGLGTVETPKFEVIQGGLK